MSENLQTRTEHSRSMEDAEKYRALQTLKEIGLLIPLSEIETFHGRVGTEEETDWIVDPTFTNGKNDSGNLNVNSRPTLYTGERRVAEDFATTRTRGSINRNYRMASKERGYIDTPEEQEALRRSIAEKYHSEVHDILSNDSEATVLDFTFDETKLDNAKKEKYQEALKALIIPITEGSPVSWDNRNTTTPFARAIIESKTHIVPKDNISHIAAEAGIDESATLQLASAYNSQRIAKINPAYLVNQLINNADGLSYAMTGIEGDQKEIPINLEYVQRYLQEAHIVGVKQDIDSVTLSRTIGCVSLFDLEKVNTQKGQENERQKTWQKLGGVAASMGELMQPEVNQEQPLLRLLEDVYAKPDKLVEVAKRVEGYEDIFNGDAGNWEGFTLAEHTETVLRNFDESYADDLPVELIAPMRLAILAHDVGKPIASAKGEKHSQKEYNITQATDFMRKLGINKQLEGMLLAIIGDGEELAFQINVRGAGEPAMKAMRELAINTLGSFNGPNEVTEEQIDGFTEMCKILQVCDGGAYTSMAVTRKGGGRGRHRNASSFNASFAQPKGFGSRKIRLRESDDEPASSDLTPIATIGRSRPQMSRRAHGKSKL